ncbi:MAG: oligoendopeptidase F [Chloroflexi bacterium]|nr:MAG: oligoendopeptidase F [Chloroflexota bacterium]
MTSQIPTRDAVDTALKWNRESVFATRADWHAAADEVPKMLPELAAYAGRLNEGAATLADYLTKLDHVERHIMKLYFYAMMEAECNAEDKEATAMVGKVQSLFGHYGATVAFTNPELIAIGKDTLEQWIQDEPRLQDYAMHFDDLFRKQAHVRSTEVEQVLGLAMDPMSSTQGVFGMLTNADMQFPAAVGADGAEHVVAQGTLDTLYGNADREVRRSAYDSYTGEYLAHKNTLAAIYLQSVKQDVFMSRVRGYPSSLEMSLFENNIPVDVFHNLIDTYKQNIPTWHRYWEVRRKILGVEKIYPYDIWAPLTDDQPHVPFEQAVEWISQGLKPLGEDYVNALRQGCLQDRWVDRAVNKGKRQGAFSFGTYDTMPFIMMSYDDTLGAMSTLAHELGHSMHSYLSRQNQAYRNADYTLFAAEIASNFNQAMTRAYLREANPDTAFQIALIEEAMDNFHRYFFIMPTLARFELEVHQRVERGEGLTADDLVNLCADLFAEGYGDTMSYDRERVGITWATFGHLYSAYYVYAYATGISAAHEFARRILSGVPNAAQDYLGFLKAGSSKYPIDAIREAGVDMTKPDAVNTTFGVLADMVERLEKLAGV